MTESENKAITISNTAKMLSQQTLPRIKTLFIRKKEVSEKFKINRTRLERDFNRSSDEVNRLCNTYKEAVKDVTKSREKLDEAYNRNKGKFPI